MATRPARRIPSSAADPALALVCAVLGFLPFTAVLGTTFGDLPKRPGDVFAVLLTLGMTLPLAVRNRLPAVSLAIIAVCFAVHESFGYPATAGTLALLIALYSAGARQEKHRWALAITATAGYLVLCVVLSLRHSPDHLTDFVLFYAVTLVGVGIGVLVRTRRAAESTRRRLEAEAAAAAERARLARELHDVVTHHVTAMVVQSSATKYLTGSPEQVAASLDTIGDTGRRALTELRSLLSVLEATGERPSAGRAPTLEDVADLVAASRNSGQPVELVEEGERTRLARAAGLAGYRVVQEALTNAVKYADGHRTVVRIGYREEAVDIEITSEGVTGAPDRSLSGGRGLNGLRDRVREVGGELTAGAAADGVFRVHASIPAGSAA